MLTIIPGIGIVMSAISIFSRIITLFKNGQLDLESDANEDHTDSILAQIPEDQRDSAKLYLSSTEFHELISKAAEYKQLQRDNPEIFAKYEEAQGNSEEAQLLKEQLQKRYPSNYARIETIYNENKGGHDELVTEIQQNAGNSITAEMIDEIIDDQTLMNHLEEVKGKRDKNAKIGIFTDLVNIGADIATLSGVGSSVGVGLKAGVAAVEGSRKIGNAIKFGARDRGASDFQSGAEGGLFGSSINDQANILKTENATMDTYMIQVEIPACPVISIHYIPIALDEQTPFLFLQMHATIIEQLSDSDNELLTYLNYANNNTVLSSFLLDNNAVYLRAVYTDNPTKSFDITNAIFTLQIFSNNILGHLERIQMIVDKKITAQEAIRSFEAY